jgi:hypothetical protein
MQPPYFENTQSEIGDPPLPKRPANCRVYERMCVDGVLFRSPIGRGWTDTPLKSPVIAETVLGVIEIVNLPYAENGALPARGSGDGGQSPASAIRSESNQMEHTSIYNPLFA